MSTHHKFSLFYYILLDFDYVAGGESLSENFVEISGMPQKYKIFMKGLWHMDRQEFSVCSQQILFEPFKANQSMRTESTRVHLSSFADSRLCRRHHDYPRYARL